MQEPPTVQKIQFFLKDLFSKCEQIRRKLQIYPHLPKKSSTENFISYIVNIQNYNVFKKFKINTKNMKILY